MNLKRIGALLVLTFVFGFTGAAQTQCLPGQTETMPCLAAPQDPGDGSTDPGQLETPPAPEAIDLTSLAGEVITALVLFAI